MLRFVAIRDVLWHFVSGKGEEGPEDDGIRVYAGGPVQFPRNMTRSDVAIVALQQEGGFNSEQMKKIMQWVVTFRGVSSLFVAVVVTLTHVSLRFRYHNENLHSAVKKDFRRLREKVENNTLTGDEPHKYVFTAKTPPGVLGTVPEVQVRNSWHYVTPMVTFRGVL
jgi:hypothetical protein